MNLKDGFLIFGIIDEYQHIIYIGWRYGVEKDLEKNFKEWFEEDMTIRKEEEWLASLNLEKINYILLVDYTDEYIEDLELDIVDLQKDFVKFLDLNISYIEFTDYDKEYKYEIINQFGEIIKVSYQELCQYECLNKHQNEIDEQISMFNKNLNRIIEQARHGNKEAEYKLAYIEQVAQELLQ